MPAPLNSRDAESTISRHETSTASVQVSPRLFRTFCQRWCHGGITSRLISIVILHCLPTDFAVYETFPFHSVSVESYEFNEDQFVAFAQPDSGFCTLYIWDHVEMVFRRFHNITCKFPAMKASISYHSVFKKFILMAVRLLCISLAARSAVYCKPVVINNSLYMVVAQLFGGSHIYK